MKPRRFVRMFKPQFAHLVEAGKKCQTVRPKPKRIPERGDIIDCRAWSGLPYRSPQRRLLEAFISDVIPITISWSQVRFPTGCLSAIDAEKFAYDDGFVTLQAMLAWFEHEHGLPFVGIVIKWGPV